MKVHLRIGLSILYVGGCICLAQYAHGQYPSKGIPPSQWLQSRQGYPDQPDVIAHAHISKGTHLACTQVEHHPKHENDGAGCMLRFADGDKQTLTFGQQSLAPLDGEVYLECAGDRPTSCTVWWWRD